MARHEPVITSDPKRQFGQPCIAGTRIPAQTIAEMHWAGDGVDALADDYGIDRLDVLWCCAWWGLNGHLYTQRGRRRMQWVAWADHALRFLGGWEKRLRKLCDPDDFEIPEPAGG